MLVSQEIMTEATSADAPVVAKDACSSPFDPYTAHRHIDPYAGMISVNPPEATTSIYQDNQQQSPLLRLPAEIRQMIYAYALGNLWITIHEGSGDEFIEYIARPIPTPLLIPTGHENYNYYRDPPEHTESERQRHIFALPQCCRQLYAESYLLIYSLNIFNFPYPSALEVFEIGLSDEVHVSDEAGYINKRAMKRVVVPYKWAEWVCEGSNLPFTFIFPELQIIYAERDRVRNESEEGVWCHFLEEKERHNQERYEGYPRTVRVECLDKEIQLTAEWKAKAEAEAEARRRTDEFQSAVREEMAA